MMFIRGSILQYALIFLFLSSPTLAQFKFNIDLDKVPETGNYTCKEMVQWLSTEKHYSNDKKKSLFSFLDGKNCETQPVVMLKDISFGYAPGGKDRSYFINPTGKKSVKKCSTHDEVAVAWLSNYSINNNFSHFLHGLLRLFCALVDARLIVWDVKQNKYIEPKKYTIWLDEWFRMTDDKKSWLNSFHGATMKSLTLEKGECVSSSQLLYGSGCVRLLSPEKWFGYPGCRAGEVLPAFGTYMRQVYTAQNAEALRIVDEQSSTLPGLRVAFAVRDVGSVTGKRQISNLNEVQRVIQRTQRIRSAMENVTFEHLDVPSTVRYMAGVHIFVSVHGAGMTNMFFMNRGSAVVEIIPYPLCNCRSPDYFYGTGGYYHGSAVAQGIKHYHYCVPANEVKWHEKPKDLRPGTKCDWRALHAVESLYVDPTRFVSLMRNVERDLIVGGTIALTTHVINIDPGANG